jgi:hypothetical protein
MYTLSYELLLFGPFGLDTHVHAKNIWQVVFHIRLYLELKNLNGFMQIILPQDKNQFSTDSVYRFVMH